MKLSNSFVSQCREIAFSTRTERTGFVYLLIDDDVVVYIGQTVNIEQRVAWHVEQAQFPVLPSTKRHRRQGITGQPNRHCKPFSRVLALDVSVENLDLYESVLIRRLWPVFNLRAGTHTGRDNEILNLLGLPLHEDEHANAVAWGKSTYIPRPQTRGSGKAVRHADKKQAARAKRLWLAIEHKLRATQVAS